MRSRNTFTMPFHRQVLLPENKIMLKALKPYMADELIKKVLQDYKEECDEFVRKQ